jgi:hypothetical protein
VITVEFDSGSVREVNVVGRSDGVFLEPGDSTARGDTARAATAAAGAPAGAAGRAPGGARGGAPGTPRPPAPAQRRPAIPAVRAARPSGADS